MPQSTEPSTAPLEPDPDVVVREEGGEAFLLHLVTGRYFSLNPSGSLVWRALGGGLDPVAELRAAHPSVPVERLAADWAAIRTELLAEGLVRARSV